jgi:cyclopentanol dehydrogenase
MRLKNKVALITGAAMGLKEQKMGIGGATAWLFAKEGARVMLCDYNQELGKETTSQIRECGYDAKFLYLDVSDEQNWIDVIQKTISLFGKVDILVNSAGNVIAANIEESTVEIWDKLMAIHAKGPFFGTKHVIPEMKRIGGGSIINISSINGLTGTGASPGYTAGKGAVRIFSKAAAIQYAKDGIRVNSVHPGYVETPLSRSRVGNPGADTENELARKRIAETPMGREGTATELAYGILYLASDESSFVTGSELVIDGGFYAQ